MRIVWATAEEAAALAEVHAEGFADGWSAASIGEFFQGPGVYGFLAVADRPVGMIICRVAAEDGEVLTIAVSPEVRRKGVASALVAAAIGAARQAGATAMFLEVAVDNPGAEALYASLGFRRAGRRPAYYDRGADGQVDALAMRLDLKPEGL